MAEHPLREHAAARVRERVQVRVFACGPVEDAALQSVLPVLKGMLADVSPAVVEQLGRTGFSAVVIASGLKVTDAPPFQYLRGTSIDTNIGICSSDMEPPTIAMLEQHLPSMLVHEAAHMVMNLGLGRRDIRGCPTRIAIDDAHRRALWERRYEIEPLAYILENPKEFFACTSQAWFNVGQHHQNSGVTTRSAIKVHDPRAAAVLARIWGDGAWRPEGAQREHGQLPELVARRALPALENGVCAVMVHIKIALCVGVALAIAHSSSARVRRMRRQVAFKVFMMED